MCGQKHFECNRIDNLQIQIYNYNNYGKQRFKSITKIFVSQAKNLDKYKITGVVLLVFYYEIINL